jgi:hypothetical protein
MAPAFRTPPSFSIMSADCWASATEKAALFHDTAARVYRIAEAG